MVSQRTTFHLQSLESIQTDNLVLNEEEVSVPGSLFEARQDRLTLNYNELPKDVQQLFDGYYQVRLQWSSFNSEPSFFFQSYPTKGFTSHLVPAQADYEPLFDEFGQFINKTFQIDFNSSNLISTATSATFHSFTDVKTSKIQKFMRQLTPDVDLTLFIDDFELVWEERKLKLQWTSPPTESIIKKSDIRKEIAFLQLKDLAFDIEVTGIRTVLSKEDPLPPTKTLLFIKPRHHTIDHKIQFEFETPIGLHPTLRVSNLSNLTSPSEDKCDLFIYTVLEKSLIFDKYQYDQKSLSLINSWGENDLEAPIWKVENFGSTILFLVKDEYKDEIDIKFHSRYLKPSSPNSFKLVTPHVFWACDAEGLVEDHEQISKNPFDSAGLGYESFFEDNTIFYHYKNSANILDFKIPRGDESNFTEIQFLTLISITVGTIYILLKLFKILFSSSKVTSDDKKTN